MKKIFLFVFLFVFISEGIGIQLLKKLKIEENGYKAPVGFACLLGLMQLLLYPAQLFNLSFHYVVVVCSLIILYAIFISFKNVKAILRQFWKWESVFLAISLVAFLVWLYHSSIDLEFSDSATYLNYMAMNITESHINLFDPVNGIKGSEWDLYYLFQGFYHFGAYLAWLINIPHYLFGATNTVSNIVISVWGLGMLYNILSSMLIVNIVRYFRLHSRFFETGITLFTLFYTNFAYWNISYAFYGNTYRNLLLVLQIFLAYRWIRENNQKYIAINMFVTVAGLATSSSYLFMVFAVFYGLAYYLFSTKKENALRDMMLYITPMVIYVACFISRVSLFATFGLIILWLVILKCQSTDMLSKILNAISAFLYQHAKSIFLIVIPGIFMIGTFAINILGMAGEYSYAWYFNNFVLMDMIHDYLFVYSSWQDNILNIIRWFGFILVMKYAESDEDIFIKDMLICVFVFFLNPLCVTMIVKTFTGMVFYRNWYTVFNLFTETLMFIYIYRRFRKVHYVNSILIIVLLALTVQVNLSDFMPMLGNGMHHVYFNEQKNRQIDPIEKITIDEKNALSVLQDYVNEHPKEDTLVISQSNALLTHVEDVQQVFTSRDYRYPETRINEEFYQIARYHYDWEGEDTTSYTNTCTYMEQYHVDYVVIQKNDNRQFYDALGGCTITIYENDTWSVKTAG